MQGDPNCVFCKILSGQIPDYRYWENEHAIAFLDIQPKANVHTLVIPKAHNPYIFDMESEAYTDLMLAANTVAKKLKEFTNKERVCVVVEGFAVPHVHVHLVPSDTPEEFAAPALAANPADLRTMQEKLKVFFANT